jgi:hypothetical protein
MKITVQDFTGVYAAQPFMQELRNAAKTSKDIRWLDCTKIVGTDCYCDDDAVKAINELIDGAETTAGIHFFDNGNYHYMSKLWTDRIQEPFTLIVFDHHPDMQPPRFGGILSCGGWVLEVLENNKFVQNVIIIGVKEELVETACEELSQSGESNILDKVTFIRESELNTLSPQTTLSSFVYRLSSPHSLYISIDKDALAPAYAATNWDQGSLTLDALKECISALAANHKILGIDICGERAHNFEGDANHTVQEADTLNDSLNRELVEFLNNL